MEISANLRVVGFGTSRAPSRRRWACDNLPTIKIISESPNDHYYEMNYPHDPDVCFRYRPNYDGTLASSWWSLEAFVDIKACIFWHLKLGTWLNTFS